MAKVEKSLQEMTKDIVKTFSAYQKTGTKKWGYSIAARDLSYQVGSLVKLIMQLDGERHKKGASVSAIKDGVSDELADILAEVLFIAHELDIDIHKAWESMLISDSGKIVSRRK